jgi:hypothetical protein
MPSCIAAVMATPVQRLSVDHPLWTLGEHALLVGANGYRRTCLNGSAAQERSSAGIRTDTR